MMSSGMNHFARNSFMLCQDKKEKSLICQGVGLKLGAIHLKEGNYRIIRPLYRVYRPVERFMQLNNLVIYLICFELPGTVQTLH